MRKLKEIKTGVDKTAPNEVAKLPIILALESEQMGDVTNRMSRYPEPVVLAVYYPETAKLILAELTTKAPTVDTLTATTAVTVGMILDSHRTLALPDNPGAVQVTQLAGA
jgi:hypothetical protein